VGNVSRYILHRIIYLQDALKQKKKTNFDSDDDEDGDDDDDDDYIGDVTMTIFPLYSVKIGVFPPMQKRKIKFYFFTTKNNLRRNVSLICTCWLLMKALKL
jgi:hypothetical protein